ncbi:MAG: hypothetical protein ACRDY4_04300 [Acidimicrobiia bacterium]
MDRHLDRVLAWSGTLTFLLGWAAIVYLMIDPSFYAETVGRGSVETALAYGRNGHGRLGGTVACRRLHQARQPVSLKLSHYPAFDHGGGGRMVVA